ncbi:hypothetical protein OE903_10225 [Bacillus sp. B6(2022)]|nr:hypothetical protein [Bacillus sp. B6(2022)]
MTEKVILHKSRRLSMKLEKGSGIGKLSKLFKSIFFRRKISFIAYENDALSKLPASNQRNVRFEDELLMICLIPLLVLLIQMKGASPMLKWPILLGWILLNFYVLQPIIHRYELRDKR